MAWTTPRTWVVGEVVTASLLNTHIRDNLSWLATDRVYSKVTAKDVVSSVTETDLLNSEITIAANAMGTNRVLRCVLAGDALSSGVNAVNTFRIKYGGTTFWSDTDTLTDSASRRPWRIVFEIVNLGAANAQAMFGFFSIGSVGTVATGLGDLDVANASGNPIGTSADQAIDTTSAQALAITVQHDTNSANVSTRLKYFYAEIIGV